MGIGKVVLAVGVYDNADILRDFIDWHLELDVDFVVAFDYGSTDGSRDILDHYMRRGLLHWRHLPNARYLEFNPFLNIAKIATDEFNAEWILIFDPDEFLCVEGSGLRQVLDDAFRRNISVLTIPRHNMTGTSPVEPCPAVYSLTLRIDRTFAATKGQKAGVSPMPWPAIFVQNSPKTIVRGQHLIEVGPGSHSAKSLHGLQGREPALRILHYPVRLYSSFETKVRNVAGWLAKNSDLAPSFGWHWRRLVSLDRAGRLREEFDQQFFDCAKAAELLRSGDCVRDETLAHWKALRSEEPQHLD